MLLRLFAASHTPHSVTHRDCNTHCNAHTATRAATHPATLTAQPTTFTAIRRQYLVPAVVGP